MKKNVGKTDMIVRLVFAAVLLLCYFIFNIKDFAGIIIILLAIILAVTAFTRTCPLWYVFRANTLEKEKKE
jgi:energy-coupling factor transporter transmembrane protein EcfT